MAAALFEADKRLGSDYNSNSGRNFDFVEDCNNSKSGEDYNYHKVVVRNSCFSTGCCCSGLT